MEDQTTTLTQTIPWFVHVQLLKLFTLLHGFWHTGPVTLVLFCIYTSLGRPDPARWPVTEDWLTQLWDLTPSWDGKCCASRTGWPRRYLADFSKFTILQTSTSFLLCQICLMIIMIVSLSMLMKILRKRSSLPKGRDCSILWKLQDTIKSMDSLTFWTFELLNFTQRHHLGDSAPMLWSCCASSLPWLLVLPAMSALSPNLS